MKAGRDALKKAGSSAENILRSLQKPDEDMPGGSPERPRAQGPAGPASPAPEPSAAPGGLDLSRPSGPAELAMAYDAGFKKPFESLGLQVVKDADGAQAVVRLDGSPATPAEVARLAALVSEEPRALMRRPDYFSVLPRESFEGLKETLSTRPSSPHLKDVAASQDGRDLEWERTCDKVSGDCNRHAKEGSYKKEEKIAPETLLDIWDAIMEEADGTQEANAKLGRRAVSLSDWGGLGKLASEVGSLFGFGGTPTGQRGAVTSEPTAVGPESAAEGFEHASGPSSYSGGRGGAAGTGRGGAAPAERKVRRNFLPALGAAFLLMGFWFARKEKRT